MAIYTRCLRKVKSSLDRKKRRRRNEKKERKKEWKERRNVGRIIPSTKLGAAHDSVALFVVWIRLKGNRDRPSSTRGKKRAAGRTGRRGRGDIARRRLQCCNDVRAHPGRRLTRLTFGQPRNIDARYRSPLHFLELWSITAVLSRLAWVHDYRPLAAADRDNLLTVYLLRKRSNSGPPLSQVFHFLCIRIEYFLSSFLLERIIWFRSTN